MIRISFPDGNMWLVSAFAVLGIRNNKYNETTTALNLFIIFITLILHITLDYTAYCPFYNAESLIPHIINYERLQPLIRQH